MSEHFSSFSSAFDVKTNNSISAIVRLADPKSIFDEAYMYFFGLGEVERNITQARVNLQLLVDENAEGSIAAMICLALLNCWELVKKLKKIF